MDFPGISRPPPAFKAEPGIIGAYQSVVCKMSHFERLIAPCHYLQFDIEAALDIQLGSQPLPFPGMDKSGVAICSFYRAGLCSKGNVCPFRHSTQEKKIVCKHWLRGLCKKGDQCEFLHEYDMARMPECFFFAKFGTCANQDCHFRHINPEQKIKDCPWYDRGFCKHGASCKHRHRRKVVCINYMVGFCPEGPVCHFTHPKWMDPMEDHKKKLEGVTCHHCGEKGHKIQHCFKLKEQQDCVGKSKLGNIRCIICGEIGHVSYSCPKKSFANNEASQMEDGVHTPNRPAVFKRSAHGTFIPRASLGSNRVQREYVPRDQLVCFKCGEKGHTANRCPLGKLAFLHQTTLAKRGEQQP